MAAQPARHRHVVERDRIRVRPRVVGVDGGRERGELAFDLFHAAVVGRREPCRRVADERALVQHVGQLAGFGHVARDQGEAEFGDQLLIRGVRVADHLAAELDDSAVVERHLFDATADSIAGLENQDVGSTAHEVARGGQAGQPGPDDDEVVSHCESS